MIVAIISQSYGATTFGLTPLLPKLEMGLQSTSWPTKISKISATHEERLADN
jgi:hypothetical protein